MLDGISPQRSGTTTTSRPSPTPTPTSAPASAPPASAPDRFESRPVASPAAPPVDKGQAAAQAEVTVSDQEVRDQRDEVRAEGLKATQDTQQELTDRAREIESHQDDPRYMVEIEDRGDTTVYREREIGEDNRIIRETYLEVHDGQPPKVVLDETRRDGDHWVQEHQQAEGGGEKFKQESYQIAFREYPGSPLQFPFASLPSYDPGRIGQRVTSFSSDGGDVSKRDSSLEFGDYGQVTRTKDAVAEFKERQGGDVDLPGNIDDTFDDGQPVIESRISIGETGEDGEEKVIADEHHWSQGKTRVSERSGGDGPDTFLVEKQSDDGRSKDSQLLVKGAQESVRTHTELNADGSVSETQELWDTNDGVIGRDGDGDPKLLQRTTSTRTYGDDGRLATQHKQTEDLQTGEKRVEDYSRKVENGIATYNTRQQITDKDGHTTGSTVEEKALVHSDGEKPFSTTIRSGDTTVQIAEDSRGRHVTSTNSKTGEKVQGEVRPSADGQGIDVSINGKTLHLNADGSFKDDGELDGLSPAEFSAIPFLATGARGVKGLADSLGQDADQVEENLASKLKDGWGDKLKAAGQGIGAALSA
ncbi:MAG TPA: hypothetical protein VFB81_20955, partial [Myxococcales bacterium]|nr:hypothetical protein [Myxococcales bacterium]